jgi:hypothetical protein
MGASALEFPWDIFPKKKKLQKDIKNELQKAS